MKVSDLRAALANVPDDLPVLFAVWHESNDEDLLPTDVDEYEVLKVNHIQSNKDINAFVLLHKED